MDGTESMITEQPDPEKPWGIGCVVCSRYHAWLSTKTKTAVPLSAWASFSVGSLSGGRKNLGILDRLQHVGRAGDTKPPNKFHAEAMETAISGPRTLTPSRSFSLTSGWASAATS